MQFVRANIMKWKREKSIHKYTRIDEFSKLFLDAVYENNFEPANIFIDDGIVDVKYKEQMWLYSTHSRLSVDDINN